METWPDVLPSWQKAYGYELGDDLIRTDISGGPIAVVRRTATGSAVFSVSARMSDIQLAIFEAWVKMKIKNGLDWFLCPVITASGVVTNPVRITGGKPVHAMATPGWWTVTMKIEMER